MLIYNKIKDGIIVIFITIGGLLTVPFTIYNLQVKSHFRLLRRMCWNGIQQKETYYDDLPSLHSIGFLIYKLAIVSVSVIQQQHRAYTYTMLVSAKLAEQRLMFEMLVPVIDALSIKKKPRKYRKKIVINEDK